MRYLILSAAATAVLCIVAVRSLNREGREAAVIEQIHTLQTAQVDYYSTHGRYAASVEELAPELVNGESNGYRFHVTANGNSYTILAEPAGSGVSARRSFFSDETMVVRESQGPEPATIASPAVK
jgi:type IV pilus assembly protein PilA